MKRLIISAVATWFYIHLLFSANYYVDAITGSDSNPGTSPEQAWKTVGKVNEFTFQPGDVIHFRAGQVWRESLQCQSGKENAPLTYTRYGGGAKPLFLASIDLCFEYIWATAGNKNIWTVIPPYFSTGEKNSYKDIGNIILTPKGKTSKKAAWKRWSIEELTSQDDFYHDTVNDILYFYSETNPALLYNEMEAAMRQNIFVISHREHFIIDGLAAAYTGAHGAVGDSTRNAVIRNCDFSWIGGSLIYIRNGNPTRYGNGVEFWDNAQNNIVENNYFEHIYDVAMTNQGRGACVVENVTWRNNKIYRCCQAYEFWFSNKEAQVKNIVFENNECIDSGFGWSYEQRPDKNGTHLLAYSAEPKKLEIRYRGNLFNNARNAHIWFFNSRLNEIHSENNTFIQKGDNCDKAPLFRWDGKEVGWEEYRRLTGNDKNSLFKCE